LVSSRSVLAFSCHPERSEACLPQAGISPWSLPFVALPLYLAKRRLRQNTSAMKCFPFRARLVRNVVAFAFVAQSFVSSAKSRGFCFVAKFGAYVLGGLNGGGKYPAKSKISATEKLSRPGLIAGNFALALNWNGGSGQFNP
jgi:hypothetical protein